MANRQYIRLIDEWGGFIAELCGEYNLGQSKTPMYDFYNVDGKVFCIKQSQAEIISEKKFFMLRLAGAEIFLDC